jgi:hypothetical protein
MTVDIITSISLGVCAGIAATVTMDVLGGLSRRVGLTVGAKGTWVGRWYLGILRGQLRHANITASPKLSGEKLAALAGHYAIGIALAILYVVGAAWLAVSPDGLLLALGYGLATCVFPWFLVFPSLGFGVLGLRGPSELKLFTSSLVNHLSYGFGLWWFAHAFISLVRLV